MPDIKTQILQALQSKPPIDNRLYNTIYAEAGGGNPSEVRAVANVFLNRILKEGYEKALKGSSAYNKKSKQYKLAESGKFNPYELNIYNRNKKIIDYLTENLSQLKPYYYFENIKAFGEPKWSKGLNYEDIGRQRFYWK